MILPGSSDTAPLSAAVLLALVYLLGPRLLEGEGAGARRALSAAAGASMTYVFLDILPELGARHDEFLRHVGPVVFAEHRIYLGALLGFVVMYALEQMVHLSPGGGTAAADRRENAVFWIDTVGFALYGWVIADALESRAERGPIRLWLYVAAMAFHLLLVAHSLSHRQRVRYRRHGRWVLAGSVVLGWLSATVHPLRPVVMDRLFAFVAGGVIMASASEEIPRGEGGRLGWFVFGVAAYGALLLST